MKKIAIVVDSTASMTYEEAASHENIFLIPLMFIFGDEIYRDGIDLSIKEFFEKSEELFLSKNVLPTTSQPSIGACSELFEKVLQDFDEIIYLPLSKKISGTYQCGVLAATEFDGKVHVVDTLTTAAGLKLAALVASKMVKEGKSVEEVCRVIEEIRQSTEVFFVVSDLKHLQRTGRIGPAAASIGNALQLKPILKFIDGEILSLEKVRNLNKAHKKLLAYILSKNLNDNWKIFFVVADSDEYVKFFVDGIKEVHPNIEIEIDDLSPVIATNTGPGVIGVFLFNELKLKIQ